MNLPLPEVFHPVLSSDRLEIVADILIAEHFTTATDLQSDFDDGYTRGSASAVRRTGSNPSPCRGSTSGFSCGTPVMTSCLRLTEFRVVLQPMIRQIRRSRQCLTRPRSNSRFSTRWRLGTRVSSVSFSMAVMPRRMIRASCSSVRTCRAR